MAADTPLLPTNIEQEIKVIEADYNARRSQHAGVSQLRGLRLAIRSALLAAEQEREKLKEEYEGLDLAWKEERAENFRNVQRADLAEQEQERLKAELAEANTIRACNLQAAQRFEGEIRALQEYVDHKPECDIYDWGWEHTPESAGIACTCGLSGLLQGPPQKDDK